MIYEDLHFVAFNQAIYTLNDALYTLSSKVRLIHYLSEYSCLCHTFVSSDESESPVFVVKVFQHRIRKRQFRCPKRNEVNGVGLQEMTIYLTV